MAAAATRNTGAVMELWPHQKYAIAEVKWRHGKGVRRVCVTSPTGGGKSKIIEHLARWGVNDLRRGVAIYTNRKMLLEQLTRDFTAAGIPFGVRAADHFRNLSHPVQLCSVQTDFSRVLKHGRWVKHDSGLVLVDEAHVNNTDQCNKVVDEHLQDGAMVVGLTATPLGLGYRYDQLIQAGLTSELQACGALVPATHFGCDEPSLKFIKNYKLGDDYTENQVKKAIMVPGVFGRVVDWFRRTNPHGLPSIGFAPGVKESIGFAEAFEAAGIPAAHVDGEEIWFRGSRCRSTETTRAELQEASRTGKVRVVWNRFVLREGINMPWLAHCVLATVFGSLKSYLQACGRLVRAYPGLGRVTIQDHGGNWWRHGSINDDREWDLAFTDAIVSGLRQDVYDYSEGDTPPPPEPFVCPACKGVVVLAAVRRGNLATCPHCGFLMDFTRRGRTVIEIDGSPIEHPGGPFRRRRIDCRPDTQKLWTAYFWRARNSKTMTFRQAVGLFAHEHYYWPPRHLPFMPVLKKDWYRAVSAVPFNQLRPKGDDA